VALEDEMRDVSTLLSDIARILDETNGLLSAILDRLTARPEDDPDAR
jgi:hypothetical protein